MIGYALIAAMVAVALLAVLVAMSVEDRAPDAEPPAGAPPAVGPNRSRRGADRFDDEKHRSSVAIGAADRPAAPPE